MGLIQTAESVEQHVKAAYTALQANGASLPEQRNLANLAGCVAAIEGDVAIKIGFTDQSNLVIQDFVASNMGVATYFAQQAFNNRQSSGIIIPFSNTGTASTTPATLIIEKSYISSVELDFHNRAFPDIGLAQYLLGGLNNNTYTFKSLRTASIKNVLNIPAYFGYGGFADGENELVLGEGIGSLGANFLGQSQFSGGLTLPSTLVDIGAAFMVYCDNFTGPLYIPEGVPAPDVNSLTTQRNTTPAYVNGVTLTGPGAAAWKAALPDRASSSYRKLILA